jgi:hypothetical protein
MSRSLSAVTFVTVAALSTYVVGVRASVQDPAVPTAAPPVGSASAAVAAEARRPGAASAHDIPLLFAENRGQFDPQARFSTRYRGINAFVTAEGFRLGLWSPDAVRFDPKSEDRFEGRSTAKISNVFLTFEGTDGSGDVVGEAPTPTKFNYFLGPEESGWKTDVPTYARVRHRDLYRGVDVVLGDRQGRLEYDVVVKPGGDLSRVVVRVEGSEGLELRSDGTLLAKTAAGPLVQTAPVAFVRGRDGSQRDVPCRFELVDGERFRFAAEGYGADEELVVDPGLIFSYTLTGSLADQANGVGDDALMNCYLGGRTASNNFPVVPGSFDVSLSAGNFDAFVAKIDTQTAQLAYCTFLGGGGMDYVSALRVDAVGNVYATGQAGASSFPTTAGAYDTSYNGQGDGYVTKVNPLGNGLVFSTYVGGTSEERMHGIALDTTGAVYIVGQTLSHANFPGATTQTIPIGANYNVGAVNWNLCVAKINPNGNSLGYGFRTGGDGNDWAYGVAVSLTNECVIVGGTTSTTYPVTPTCFDTTPNGGFDAFMLKVSPTAQFLLASTYLGGPGADQAISVDVDQFGSIYVAGGAGVNFPTTAGAFDTTGDGSDGFVTKFDPSGFQLVWSTYLGGTSTEQINQIRVDQGIRPIVAGFTNSANFPTTSSGYSTTFSGGGSPAEAFLAKLTWTGNALLYSSFVGGNANDDAAGLDLDTFGWAYVSGTTLSTAANFLAGSGFSNGSTGVDEAYSAKFELPASPAVWNVGQGCSFTPGGSTPAPPTFSSTLPTLGEILTFFGSNAAPLTPGSILLSMVPAYPLPISAECTLYFDPLSVLPIAAYIASATGDWASAFYLVNDPSWVGAILRLQSFALTPTSPWGFELSNGIDVEFGY